MSASGKRFSAKEESSSKRKKKNEQGYNDKESERKASKKKRKGLDKDSKKGRLKVQSVSELADLITSGAIQVPRSLTHYLNDRVQLLDQVFTILSTEDVKGKLPDILKGLKVKQVRKLCCDQLKSMSDNQIVTAIANSEPCPSSLRGSENEVKQEPVKVEAMEVGDGDTSEGKWKDAGGDVIIISAEEKSKSVLDEAVHMVLDVSDISDSETAASRTLHAEPGKKSCKKKLELQMFEETLCNEDGKKDGGGHGGNSDAEGEGGGRRKIGCDGGTEMDVRVEVGGRRKVGCDDGRAEMDAWVEVGGRRKGGCCDGGGSAKMDVREGVEQERVQLELEKIQLPSHEKEGGKRKEESETPRGCKTLDDKNRVDLHLLSGATEDAEQLEMKLRRRALESELRRSKQNISKECINKETQQLQTEKSENEVVENRGLKTNILGDQSTMWQWDEMTEQPLCDDFISIHPCYEGSEEEEGRAGVKRAEEEGRAGVKRAEKEGSEKMNIGELLEEKLRRRALQSMLSRRKAKSST